MLIPVNGTEGGAWPFRYVAWRNAWSQQERDYIQRALAANDWRVQDTARLLCISRKTLWEKMKRLEIQREA